MPAVKRLQVVLNALRVLEEVAARAPVGVTALARATDLDKSGVQRILMTLHGAGYIRPVAGGPTRWELANRPRELFRRPRSDLVARSEPTLRRLRDTTGETILLALFEDGMLVSAAAAESPHPVRMAAGATPRSLPLVGSAAGRAVLAHLPAGEVERLVGAAAAAAEAAAFVQVRGRGWASSQGEVFADAHTVAAPVFDPAGYPLGALVVAAPAFRLTEDRMGAAGLALVAAAAELTAA